MYDILPAGHGVHDRGATDPGHTRAAAGQGEDARGAGRAVQALDRAVREPAQQIHLPHGIAGKCTLEHKLLILVL